MSVSEEILEEANYAQANAALNHEAGNLDAFRLYDATACQLRGFASLAEAIEEMREELRTFREAGG